MSYNGSGTYSLYATGNPVVTATTVSSTWANNTLNDIATGLTLALCKDGQSTPTANLPMGTFKLTGLGNGSAATDSMAYGQRMKTVFFTSTRDLSSTGTQAITTTGITPVGVLLFVTQSSSLKSSIGIDDGTTRGVVANNSYTAGGNVIGSTGFSVYMIEGGGVYTTATVTALASESFTLTWAKSGSPTGTGVIFGIAFGY